MCCMYCQLHAWPLSSARIRYKVLPASTTEYWPATLFVSYDFAISKQPTDLIERLGWSTHSSSLRVKTYKLQHTEPSTVCCPPDHVDERVHLKDFRSFSCCLTWLLTLAIKCEEAWSPVMSPRHIPRIFAMAKYILIWSLSTCAFNTSSLTERIELVIFISLVKIYSWNIRILVILSWPWH